MALILAATLLAMEGCATKKFVRQEFQGRDEQLGRLEGSLGQARTQLGDLQGQVGEVGTRADDATRRADDASQRADDATRRAEEAGGVGNQALARSDEATAKAGQAMAKAEETDTRFARAWGDRNKRSVADTVVVHFRFDRADLDDRAQTELLNAVKLLQDDPNMVVSLAGYTDKTGRAKHNLELSQRRAEAVRRFLVQHGVDMQRIQSIGLGEAPHAGKSARAQSRQVVVELLVPAG